MHRVKGLVVVLAGAFAAGGVGPVRADEPQASDAPTTWAEFWGVNEDYLESVPIYVGDYDGPLSMGEDGCVELGRRAVQFGGARRGRGNFVEITRDNITLDTFGLCLSCTNPASGDLWYSVFQLIGDEYVRVTDDVIRNVTCNPGDPICPQSTRFGFPLENGGKYLLAVTWDAPLLNYFQDDDNYPKPFAKGNVLGLFTYNLPQNTHPPLPSPINRSPANGAHWMDVCFDPEPGACCNVDNECRMATVEECGGDTFTAEGVTCEDLGEMGGCGNFPTGACCFSDSCSDDTTVFDCDALGGTFQGRGSTCRTSCPSGACCVGNQCRDLPESGCTSVGGKYRGDGTDCSMVGKDKPLPACGDGACCYDDGCLDLPANSCGLIGGTWHGDGTSCSTIDPLCPITCCSDFVCVEGATPEQCRDDFDGLVLGFGISCRPDPCEDLDGAQCCLPDGRCIPMGDNENGDARLACESFFGGTFDPGESCDDPCQDVSCCINGGCESRSREDCLANGGVPYGSAEVCDARCGGGGQACCLFDSCTDTTPAACAQAGGISIDGKTCADEPCEGLICGKLKKVKAKCKGNGSLKITVVANKGENLLGTLLTLTLDGGSPVTVAFQKARKLKSTDYKGVEPGDHEVCVDGCEGLCRPVTCE